ncbi:MAG TPA: hypothetical protein VJ063_17295, partial [Verrucomicrobiae bacterium]|nr:hypothetical protein [Verrucomicrobiae bacterium]
GQKAKHGAAVTVMPGETIHVQIGGGGTSVSGHLITSKPVDWSKPFNARLEPNLPRLPDFGLPTDPTTHRRKAEFWLGAQGISRSRANQMFPLEIDSTGTFHIHDVPAGSYRFVAAFPNASLITNVTIPDETAVDLGDLVLR